VRARQAKIRGIYFVVAILDRGRAGDADGSDNFAIRDEGNAAFERRGSVPRERAQPKAALRCRVLEQLAWAPEVKRAARLILGDRDRAVPRVCLICATIVHGPLACFISLVEAAGAQSSTHRARCS
jgi:hypothetical protein